MPAARKLIEVALPLDAINQASAREKSIRHGHPSTLHLWWARRPLAAARAVIFTSLVDDPDDPNALPAFVAACEALPGDGPNVKAKGDSPRMRLFDFIERLVTWEATTDEKIMGQARELIQIATEGKPPPLLDPFAGGGSIPLEAQRLGLEAHASDLNPVAVMINKAMIEIPPRFANRPPVNPRDRADLFPPTPNPSPHEEGRGLTADERAETSSPSLPVGARGRGMGGENTWKGAAGLAADVRYYGEWMREQAFERIGHLYPKHKGETVIAWLWARTVISPNPAVNAPVPLVSSFALSKKKGRKCWAKPVIEGKSVRFEITPGEPPKGQDGTMIRRQGARCIISGTPITFDYIKQESKAGRLGATLLAIVTEGKRGRNYHNPASEHVQIAESAVPAWRPVGEMEEGNQNVRGRMWGLRDFADLFTPRQLTALTTFSDLVHEARELATADALAAMTTPQDEGGASNAASSAQDSPSLPVGARGRGMGGALDDDRPLRDGGSGARAYGEAVSVYLAFAVDKAANYWTTPVTWMQRGTVGQIFQRQAIAMVWDYPEINPFASFHCSWFENYGWVAKTLETFNLTTFACATLADAMAIRTRSDTIVSTDPPYYDNIGYADLSDFYYIWLRKTLRNIYPDEFSTLLVPKASELIASAHRHDSKHAAKDFFEGGMKETFTNLRRFVSHDYPLTVYYAFKQQDAGFMTPHLQGPTRREGEKRLASTGWETMLTSLIQSGFTIAGTWPMRTERPTGLKARNNALASSIVLVCRPRPADAPATSRRRFLAALRAELPAAIAKMKTGSVAPVDMAQATIGPGMAIYSRYRAVLEADGTPLSVRAALGFINAALDEALEEQDALLDPETRFAVGWFDEGGFKAGDFGRADVLARGKNTSVESAALAGVVEAEAGKVRLIHWREYDPGAYDPRRDKRATAWEGTHHLIERLQHGEERAAALYNALPDDVAESARDLAYRLYHVCERNGWAEDALDYNTLVSSWSEISRLAASARAHGEQAEMALDP